MRFWPVDEPGFALPSFFTGLSFRAVAVQNQSLKELAPFNFLLALGLGLVIGTTSAQINPGHYLVGTAGIQAGSLPPPGVYIDDLNWYGSSSTTLDTGQYYQSSTYVNEPRLRWITKAKLFGANYDVEVMLPWIYQEQKQASFFSLGPIGLSKLPFPSFFIPGYRITQREIADLEISPLLLSWHLQHFDIMAGYALWVPTGNNDFTAEGNTTLNPSLYFPPPQFHWWEHMLTLGGTWYPDAGKKWAVSALTHYEISQSLDSTAGYEQYGQIFKSEWGISRTLGKYFALGFIGNYSRQTTASQIREGVSASTFYSGFPLEIGPEINFTAPKLGFSAAFRYLHEVEHDGAIPAQHYPDVLGLTVSQRF